MRNWRDRWAETHHVPRIGVCVGFSAELLETFPDLDIEKVCRVMIPQAWVVIDSLRVVKGDEPRATVFLERAGSVPGASLGERGSHVEIR